MFFFFLRLIFYVSEVVFLMIKIISKDLTRILFYVIYFIIFESRRRYIPYPRCAVYDRFNRQTLSRLVLVIYSLYVHGNAFLANRFSRTKWITRTADDDVRPITRRIKTFLFIYTIMCVCVCVC